MLAGLARVFMAVPQQKLREIVFQLLYSHDFAAVEEEEIIPFLMKELCVAKSALYLAGEKRRAVEEKQKEIDQRIAGASDAYAFARIPGVERNILRLGVYELFYDPLIPPKVAIAEAIRLARKFATPQGATFVNAILDTLYQESEKKDAAPALV